MNRIQRAIIFILPILGGMLPIIVYSIEHGGLGVPTFSEHQTMTQMEQFAQLLAGLYIKPIYMLISFALIIGLWGQTSPEMLSLFWGLSAFLIGETFCAFNFIIYKHASITSEYIHSYGMALAFGLITYFFLEIIEKHLLRINNEYDTTRRIAMLIIVMASILSFLPLPISTSPKSYLTDLFGFPYSYARFDFYQWYETRALPLLALFFFIIALLPLFKSKGDPIPQLTKIFFSAGFGALSFSLFRLTLASMFANNLVWFEFWEELTELMFTSAMGFMLWQFGHTLLQKHRYWKPCYLSDYNKRDIKT